MLSKKLVQPKDVYLLNPEETKNIVDTSVMTHFHPSSPPLKPVLAEDSMKFFMNIAKVKQMWAASSKPPIDYECISKK